MESPAGTVFYQLEFVHLNGHRRELGAAFWPDVSQPKRLRSRTLG